MAAPQHAPAGHWGPALWELWGPFQLSGSNAPPHPEDSEVRLPVVPAVRMGVNYVNYAPFCKA